MPAKCTGGLYYLQLDYLVADYGHLPQFVLPLCSVIPVILSWNFRHFELFRIIILRHFTIHVSDLSKLDSDWLEPF